MSVLPKVNPFKTIRAKEDVWGDNISWYEDYNGQTTDSVIFLVESYGLTNEDWEKMTKFLETIEAYDGVNYAWNYRDSVDIDYEDNCAYVQDYGESDVMYVNEEYIGRRQFEKEECTFDDVSDAFVNNPERALPSWLDPTDGWEERSCDFANGWYHRHDEPKEIAEKLWGKDLDVIFQISSISPFEVQFCVWTKERV